MIKNKLKINRKFFSSSFNCGEAHAVRETANNSINRRKEEMFEKPQKNILLMMKLLPRPTLRREQIFLSGNWLSEFDWLLCAIFFVLFLKTDLVRSDIPGGFSGANRNKREDNFSRFPLTLVRNTLISPSR